MSDRWRINSRWSHYWQRYTWQVWTPDDKLDGHYLTSRGAFHHLRNALDQLVTRRYARPRARFRDGGQS